MKRQRPLGSQIPTPMLATLAVLQACLAVMGIVSVARPISDDPLTLGLWLFVGVGSAGAAGMSGWILWRRLSGRDGQ
ncbi:hypothetical protein Bcav_3460 [Beutenbergia cavernae DSM 12333]|uniref:Uncharacterized protein n=1 Tax=Beutenbergia cavernae (strain ATCC BAA-8 / DSM 12333 / CCUG 43141 / JCM 11478 / NBRC 16432 / NCIMB 13614 / HKI 0122) TaxID=471853 RepID=C5C277_BEUC1|nr:hypothetical protein Bcav_3460 [Beutenbergia cavernae DSM 12333]